MSWAVNGLFIKDFEKAEQYADWLSANGQQPLAELVDEIGTAKDLPAG